MDVERTGKNGWGRLKLALMLVRHDYMARGNLITMQGGCLNRKSASLGCMGWENVGSQFVGLFCFRSLRAGAILFGLIQLSRSSRPRMVCFAGI